MPAEGISKEPYFLEKRNGKHLDIYKIGWSPHTHQDAHHDWLNSKLRPHDFLQRPGTGYPR